ncbi:MAG: deoxyribose-phosphate aldolase [Clostridia bacterium]
MNKEEILKKVDYTLLSQTATWEDIKKLCDEAIKLKTASVCIPAYYVKQAKKYVGEKMKICTVIGFPNGYSITKVKVYETKKAIQDWADEIDMVININALKEKKYQYILDEINQVKDKCRGKVLKVIVETCLLTEEEKIKMCEIISQSNADFIKTSTGFSTEGAQIVDIELFKKHLSANKKIKASGGIRTFEDAEKMIKAGAERIGTSGLKD